MFKIIVLFIITLYMFSRLAFYSLVENTCMTASFNCDGRFEPRHLV